MRKTSQDDTTSITSGVENEIKKSGTGIAKLKRNSIKKKVQSFSHESDDGVAEPLLQKDKEKSDYPNQSAKYLLSKTKTDSINENDKTDDRDRLLPDTVIEKESFTSFSSKKDNLTNGTKEAYKPYASTANSIHNHMNTNVFSSPDGVRSSIVPKTQVLVEIEGKKQGSYNSGPLIFTTAKIHTDGKSTQMEPVQVTPVPILSTVEGSVIKTSISENEKKNTGTSFGKSNNLISSIDFAKPVSAVLPSKAEPMLSGVSKVTLEDRKNQSLSNSNVLINSSMISNIKLPPNTKAKDPIQAKILKPSSITCEQVFQTVKDVPKQQESSLKDSTSPQETDLNKNFQAGPSQNNIHVPVTEILLSKEYFKSMVSTPDIVNKTIETTDKCKVPTSVVPISKNFISLALNKTTDTATKTKTTLVSEMLSTSAANVTTCLPSASANTLNKVTTGNQDSNKTEAEKSSGKSSSMILNQSKTTNTVNKELPQHQDIPSKQKTITTSSSTITSSMKAQTSTTILSGDKKIISTSKPIGSSVTVSNSKCLTTINNLRNTETLISNNKSLPATSSIITGSVGASTSTSSSVKSKLSTAGPSATSQKVISSVKPVSSTVTVPPVTSSATKSSITNSKPVTSSGKQSMSTTKPVSSTPSSTLASTSSNAKSPVSITSSNIITGIPQNSTKPISTTVTMKTKTPSSSAISTTAITPDTYAITTSAISKKSSDNKLKSTVAPNSETKKSLTDVGSKNIKITASSQAPVTSGMAGGKAGTGSDKSGNLSSKSGAGTGVNKLTQLPTPEASSNQTKSKPVPSAIVVSSQIGKPPVVSKATELQNTEHKKEKLK